jgi:hypothetical protein
VMHSAGGSVGTRLRKQMVIGSVVYRTCSGTGYFHSIGYLQELSSYTKCPLTWGQISAYPINMSLLGESELWNVTECRRL